MPDEGNIQECDISLALRVLKPKYRKILIKSGDNEKIDNICKIILNTFNDKISLKESSHEATFSILKLNCFLSTNVV